MPFHRMYENGSYPECLATTLSFLAVPVDEVDQVEESARDRSHWSDLCRTAMLSKVSRNVVPPIISEMTAKGSTRLLIRAMQMKFEILRKIDLDASLAWAFMNAADVGNMKCAMRNCQHVCGDFAPIQVRGLTREADDIYNGPLAARGEASSSPQFSIPEFIARFPRSMYVIVCSHSCRRHAESLMHLWLGRECWHPLRGTRLMTMEDFNIYDANSTEEFEYGSSSSNSLFEEEHGRVFFPSS